MKDFFLKNISEVNLGELIKSESVVLGLDIGDKTVGVAISDRRIKIASGITTIIRKGINKDISNLITSVKKYNIGVIIVGWPLQMNGLPGDQCKKVLEFAQKISEYINTNTSEHINSDTHFVKWDERFSTKVVDNLMIKADLSRKKRKKNIDRSAAVYILQGAIDFLNTRSLFS